MSNKAVIGIVVVLLLVLALVIGMSRNKDETSEPVVEEPDIVAELPTKLIANHYFNDGTHTIEGTMTLPTPCHSLSHEVVIAESFPEQVRIEFETKPGDEICAQTISDKFYQVTFDAHKDAIIYALLDGEPIELEFSETREGIIK